MRNAKSVFSRGVLVLICLVVMLSGISALAYTERGQKLLGISPAVKLSLTANVERNDKVQPVNEKTVVNTGDVIHWNLASVNDGNAAAQGYKVVGQIQAGTHFIAGSAKGESSPTVSFSIDGGKTFAEKPMIDEKQDDGSVKQVPAPTASYTHVLFKWDTALEAGQKLNAQYSVKVN